MIDRERYRFGALKLTSKKKTAFCAMRITNVYLDILVFQFDLQCVLISENLCQNLSISKQFSSEELFMSSLYDVRFTDVFCIQSRLNLILLVILESVGFERDYTCAFGVLFLLAGNTSAVFALTIKQRWCDLGWAKARVGFILW